MIQLEHLSDKGLDLLNKCLNGDAANSDMIDYLYENDFHKNEIKEFIITHLSSIKDYQDWMIGYLENL